MKYSIGVVIPTFQGSKHLPFCLPPLLQSPLKPRVLVIDSSSNDGTEALAREMGAETLSIPQKEFNHGLTREKARRYLNTDIIVMVTQDAYCVSSHMLEILVHPLLEKTASIAYARQLPHLGSGYFGAFARSFNYPAHSQLRSLEDIKTHGVYTFFCSNSCAAYLNSALDEVGGFPDVLFGEDTVVVAKLLHREHKIAYIAEAVVYHSHDYTLKQEFCRHFDIGLARHSYQNLIAMAGKDSKRGKAYVKALLKDLLCKNPWKIPYALCQTAAKLIGYRLGQSCPNAPRWFKRALSSQTFYWKD